MGDVEGPVSSAQTGLVPSDLRVEGSLVPLVPPSSPSSQDLEIEECLQDDAFLAFLQSAGIPVPDFSRLASDSGQSLGLEAGGVAPVPPVARGLPHQFSIPPATAGLSLLGPCAGRRLTSVSAVSSAAPSVGSFGRGLSNSNSFQPPAVGPLFGEQDFPPLSPAPALASAVGGFVSSSGLPAPPPASLSAAPSPVRASALLSSPAACSAGGPQAVPWNKVVGEIPSLDRSLSFFPPAPSSDGEVIIRPPVDLLRHGNSLWATSLIGGFLYSRLPFKQVESFAFRAWGRFGLQKVFLHEKGYFIFKFQSVDARDKVLASGPWYVSNKLLLLKLWKEDINFQQEASNKIPVWVRLYNVPYAYWTSDGLSYLASGIGKPLFMDPLTAKLDPLPFARICVEISAGEKLPDQLFATIFDEDSGQERLLAVRVEYQAKPQVCGGCSSFGHSQLKCPRANFQWVAKASASDFPNPKGYPPKASPKGGSPKAGPKGDPPKAAPKGDPPKAAPKGAQPKSILKGSLPDALPKGFLLKALPKGSRQVDRPKGALLPAALPKGCLSKAQPKGCARHQVPEGTLPMALPNSPNPFSVLAEDREDDREADSSEDEPPSWGPLVRRLKAIDEKESRAVSCADVGPPLRAQPKLKAKSPKDL